MAITKEESTHPFMVPGALEEPLAAIFRVLAGERNQPHVPAPGAIDQRQPRHPIHRERQQNPSTAAGSPAARGQGLPHVCCSERASTASGGSGK